MIITFKYDNSYNPSMPVIPVTLVSVDDDQTASEPIEAIVDSGADGTVIPIAYLKTIQAPMVRKARLRGITGVGIWADIYLVSMRIGPLKLSGIRVIASPGAEAILGRNVLNQLVLGLNGPAESVELHVDG